LRQAGVEPVHLRITGLLSPRSFYRVRRHLATVRPDVIHTHLDYSDFLGGLAARSLRIPSVSTVHVTRWHRPEGDQGLRQSVKSFLFSRGRRHCMARVVNVSEYARSAYLVTDRDRPDHAVVVHNGVGRAPLPGAGRAVRAELGLGAEDQVVAMVSVLRHGKGHDVAVEAVRRLRDEFPRLRLLVVGDGPRREEITSLVETLGKAGIITGHREDVMAVLDATDILLHPASVDAFPTSLLEAMAARVPVVATCVGGIPEIVVPDVTGVLIAGPPRATAVAGALAGLLGDPIRRARLAEQAAARFQEKFTAERWVARLAGLYRQILDESRR
jgi:glycosyltransferase involved in cell wall biosynthesis